MSDRAELDGNTSRQVCKALYSLRDTVSNVQGYEETVEVRGKYGTHILRARRKIKTQCLIFSDVIAVSALDTNLRIQNECLVNAFLKVKI